MKGLLALAMVSAMATTGLASPVQQRGTVDVLNGNAGWTPPPERRGVVDVLNGNAGWTPPPDKS
ncbi:hypothetical protein PG988_001397 [Apiospora saccharicola]